MFIWSSTIYNTLDLVIDFLGCKFSGNKAAFNGDIYISYGGGTTNYIDINIDGCQAGFSGAAGAALDTNNPNSATITGEAKSYSCGACVR